MVAITPQLGNLEHEMNTTSSPPKAAGTSYADVIHKELRIDERYESFIQEEMENLLT
jgi:hypothetical protein